MLLREAMDRLGDGEGAMDLGVSRWTAVAGEDARESDARRRRLVGEEATEELLLRLSSSSSRVRFSTRGVSGGMTGPTPLVVSAPG